MIFTVCTVIHLYERLAVVVVFVCVCVCTVSTNLTPEKSLGAGAKQRNGHPLCEHWTRNRDGSISEVNFVKSDR